MKKYLIREHEQNYNPFSLWASVGISEKLKERGFQNNLVVIYNPQKNIFKYFIKTKEDLPEKILKVVSELMSENNLSKLENEVFKNVSRDFYKDFIKILKS